MLTLCLRTPLGLTTDYQTGKSILKNSISPHPSCYMNYLLLYTALATDPQYSVSLGLCHKPSWSAWGRTPTCQIAWLADTPISFLSKRYTFQQHKLSGSMEDCKFDISAEPWSKQRKIISKVKAPSDGKSRCQDWIFEVFILRNSSGKGLLLLCLLSLASIGLEPPRKIWLPALEQTGWNSQSPAYLLGKSQLPE